MKKYIKPELKVMTYKVESKAICASKLSATQGVGASDGIFRPVVKK